LNINFLAKKPHFFFYYKLRLLLPKEKFLLLEFYHANAGLK